MLLSRDPKFDSREAVQPISDFGRVSDRGGWIVQNRSDQKVFIGEYVEEAKAVQQEVNENLTDVVRLLFGTTPSPLRTR